MLKLSYYFCLLLLTLGQFSLVFKVGDSNVYAFDIAVLAFSFFGFVYFLLVKKSLGVLKAHGLFLVFSLVAFVSLIFSLLKFAPPEILPGIMYFVRFFGYLAAGVIIWNMKKSALISDKELYFSIVASGVLLSLGGVLQLILLPDFEVLDPGLGWDPHKNRLASTFFDPNFVGCYLSICLLLLFDHWYREKKFQPFETAAFLTILCSVFLTFSRSAWAMLGVIIFIFGWFRSRTLLYVSLLIVFCAYFAVPRVQTRIAGATDPADSARFRLVSWSNAWHVAQKNLAIGVGFNNFKAAQKDLGLLTPEQESAHSASGSDSSLLLVLATTGVIGLMIYLAGLASSIIKEGNFNLVAFALVAGLLVDSLFINSLFYPQIMFLFFAIHSFSRT